jgi:hypothetical protein
LAKRLLEVLELRGGWLELELTRSKVLLDWEVAALLEVIPWLLEVIPQLWELDGCDEVVPIGLEVGLKVLTWDLLERVGIELRWCWFQLLTRDEVWLLVEVVEIGSRFKRGLPSRNVGDEVWLNVVLEGWLRGETWLRLETRLRGERGYVGREGRLLSAKGG